MTRFQIASRAGEAWESAFGAPARPSDDARTVELDRPALAHGFYRWLSHPSGFCVTTEDHYHHELLEHVGGEPRDCVCGTLEVDGGKPEQDLIFSSYEAAKALKDEEVAIRVEAWLREGAKLTLVDGSV